MSKRLPAALAVAAFLFAGCTKAAAPTDTASQPTDQLNQVVDSDPSAENMAKQCTAGVPFTGRTLKVVTSIAPVTSLVGQLVSGTGISVEGIIPESANGHTYKLTPMDTSLIAEADVIISVGLRMEGDFTDAAASMAKEDAMVCELGTAAISRSDFLFDTTFTKENDVPNPHVWMNPEILLRFLNHARDAITTRATADVDRVDANYVKLSQQALDLDAAMVTATATVPARNTSLYLFHDSLAYFAAHFKYQIGLVVQPPSMDDPTPAQVADAVATMSSDKATVLFGNTEFPGDFHDEIALQAGAKVEMISDENLPGTPGSADHTYGAMLKKTFTTIVTALGGDASALRALDVDLGLEDKADYGG